MGMKASFHLGQNHDGSDRDIEVEAGKLDRTVTLRVLGGWTGDSSSHSERHIVSEIQMSKAQARAVGSAFMGCAAEIE